MTGFIENAVDYYTIKQLMRRNREIRILDRRPIIFTTGYHFLFLSLEPCKVNDIKLSNK